jgi:hypothetical protein
MAQFPSEEASSGTRHDPAQPIKRHAIRLLVYHRLSVRAIEKKAIRGSVKCVTESPLLWSFERAQYGASDSPSRGVRRYIVAKGEHIPKVLIIERRVEIVPGATTYRDERIRAR